MDWCILLYTFSHDTSQHIHVVWNIENIDCDDSNSGGFCCGSGNDDDNDDDDDEDDDDQTNK